MMDKFIRFPGPGVHASYTTVEEFGRDAAGFYVELCILTDREGKHTYEVLLFTPECSPEPWHTLGAFIGTQAGEDVARMVAKAAAKLLTYREASFADDRP